MERLSHAQHPLLRDTPPPIPQGPGPRRLHCDLIRARNGLSTRRRGSLAAGLTPHIRTGEKMLERHADYAAASHRGGHRCSDARHAHAGVHTLTSSRVSAPGVQV